MTSHIIDIIGDEEDSGVVRREHRCVDIGMPVSCVLGVGYIDRVDWVFIGRWVKI